MLIQNSTMLQWNEAYNLDKIKQHLLARNIVFIIIKPNAGRTGPNFSPYSSRTLHVLCKRFIGSRSQMRQNNPPKQ